MREISGTLKDPKSCLYCEFSGRPCYIDPCASCRNKSMFSEKPRKGEDE